MKNDPLAGLEVEIGLLLRIGVSLAALFVFLGGVGYLVAHGHDHVDYRTFHSEPAGLRAIGGVWSGVLELRSLSVIQAGLIVLIATPVLRVALSAGAFARQRDWLYVGFTLIVLALLGYGLFG